mgnify:CR=1 FL=1|jgi:Flp pilus assembly protein CpaB
MRNKSTILSLVALFSGLATSIAVTRALEEPTAEPVKIVQESILVAAAGIDQGEPFNSQNVKLLECPSNQLPPDCIHDFNDLKTLIANRRIKADEPISRSNLQEVVVKTKPEISLPGRPIRLQVVIDPAVAGITAGKRVQVTIMQKETGEQPVGSRLVVHSAVVQSIDAGATQISPDSDSSLVNREASLLVSDAEHSLLLLAQELGRLQLLPSDPSGAALQAETGVCTVADLVAFAVDRKQEPVQPEKSVSPAIEKPATQEVDHQPVRPRVVPPVVRDVNTLGRVEQGTKRRPGGLARVVAPGAEGFPGQAVSQKRRVQLTVSDYQPDAEKAPTSPADLDSLRE